MDYVLRSAVWEITLACCFSCKYCGSSGGKARAGELTTEECLSLCRQLAELGCRRVSLIGGEVFLRKDWYEIALELNRLGIRVAIITNGYLFTESLIRKLRSASIESVAVSLDGPREIHDKYRQEGSFDRAVRAIQALALGGIPVSVISTLNAENAACLEETCEILSRLPILAWQLQACSPMGNAANGGVDFRFSAGEVISFVAEKQGKLPFALGIGDNIGYYTPEEGILRGNPHSCFAGCRAGLTSLGIDSVGNIRGCESMYDPRFIEGNIRDRSLAEIWEDPKSFSYNRGFTPDQATGACRSCPHLNHCAGGCRSYNHFVHGKLYESPHCARIYP